MNALGKLLMIATMQSTLCLATVIIDEDEDESKVKIIGDPAPYFHTDADPGACNTFCLHNRRQQAKANDEQRISRVLDESPVPQDAATTFPTFIALANLCCLTKDPEGATAFAFEFLVTEAVACTAQTAIYGPSYAAHAAERPILLLAATAQNAGWQDLVDEILQTYVRLQASISSDETCADNDANELTRSFVMHAEHYALFATELDNAHSEAVGRSRNPGGFTGRPVRKITGWDMLGTLNETRHAAGQSCSEAPSETSSTQSSHFIGHTG
jgi:hypothetical protein